MGYFKKTVKGFSWMGGYRILTRIISLARTAILARILTPSQFGVFGVATLFLAFLEIFTETGVNVFLIQEKKGIKKYVDTAWVVSLIRGILISLILLLSANFVSKFFKSPESYNLLVLLSLAPLIRGLINPSVVEFQKKLEFNRKFWFDSSVFLVESIFAIILTYFMRSPMGMVISLIIGAIYEVILSFVFVKPIPKLKFESVNFKRIIKTGKWITIAGTFDYLASQGDSVAVGRLLNTASLGLYQMAYKISTLPVTEIGNIVGKVTFPVYVKILGDKLRLKTAYIKTFMVTWLLVLPIVILFIVFPGEIIRIVLGDNWLGAKSTLQILAIYGLFRTLSSPGFSLFLSLKRQKIVTLITLVRMTVLLVTIIPLTINYGIKGASISALLSSLVEFPLVSFFVVKNLAIKN